ncbi:proline dehydrogenase [Streptomyces sp. NPDC050523]|uniref:proline dehydrogenase n=1 Tax=Streptomyces sp. NPDC050523 TaxID=3365622 RepID=UPI0037926F73
MDAGLAAVLGAVVGSLAALGAAIVSGRVAARSQFDQWRRQHRREAYASYLSALHDRDVAMDAIFEVLRPHQPDLQSVDEKVQRFIALAREVHRAAEVVVIEGPSAMVRAADDVARASGGLSDVMQRMVKNAHAGDSSHKTADAALAAERERVLYQAVKSFRSAARDVLGSPN